MAIRHFDNFGSIPNTRIFDGTQYVRKGSEKTKFSANRLAKKIRSVDRQAKARVEPVTVGKFPGKQWVIWVRWPPNK